MNPYAEPVERDNLMRHRANCVSHAVWGLYNAHSGDGEPRRWEPVAPKTLSKGSGSSAGSALVEMGDGTRTLGHNRVPVPQAGRPGMLSVRVGALEALGLEPHRLTLFRADYEAALSVWPRAWAHAWKHFERSSFLLSPFGLVTNRRTQSAYFRANTSTSDPFMCAALWLAELGVPQAALDELPPERERELVSEAS